MRDAGVILQTSVANPEFHKTYMVYSLITDIFFTGNLFYTYVKKRNKFADEHIEILGNNLLSSTRRKYEKVIYRDLNIFLYIS